MPPRLIAIALALIAMAASPACIGGQWVTTETIDKMTSSKTVTATIRSDNSMALRFPYAGENHGSIAVRNTTREGLNVIVGIDKGQIICGYGDNLLRDGSL